MALVVDKFSKMDDALSDPEAFDWPTCRTCGKAMRLVGLGPAQKAYVSVHTYECSCGAVAVDEVSNN
jgi:autonomous glycyl radical cofactor GrcA